MCKQISLICRDTEVPKDWNFGIIVPIHKKGDQMSCDNYRGITILNMAYEILHCTDPSIQGTGSDSKRGETAGECGKYKIY